jgi:uncharacterized lipoprotein YmbA
VSIVLSCSYKGKYLQSGVWYMYIVSKGDWCGVACTSTRHAVHAMVIEMGENSNYRQKEFKHDQVAATLYRNKYIVQRTNKYILQRTTVQAWARLLISLKSDS